VKRALLSLAALLALSVAGAQTEPSYEGWTKYLLSLPDYRLEQMVKGLGAWPYVEVLRKDRWREYQKGPCDPQNDPNACQGRMSWNEAKAHEFYLPMSSLEATQEVARDLRKAWQRFEERYYWRVITELNNPAFWFAYCLAGIKGPDLDPPIPQVKLFVPSGSVDQAYLQAATRSGSLDMGTYASMGTHRLDRYLPIPQIPSDDFCDGLGMQILPLMFIPGFKVMIQGSEVFRTPGYPSRPLWFNDSEAQARVERAMQKALTDYYREYQEEVARILLTPRPSTPESVLSGLGGDIQNLGAPKVYLPVPWQGHLLGGGSVVAPVYTELFPRNPTALWDLVQAMWDTYKARIDQAGTNIEKVYHYVHFYRSARLLLNSKAFYGLPGVDTLKENLKRMVETPLRSLTQGIPVLNACTGSLDQVVACAVDALTKVDLAVKGVGNLQELTGSGNGQEPIKADKESPGLWKWEESKRWLPPASLPVYEAFGYVSMFQATNFIEATTVPDIRGVDLSNLNLSNWIGFAWSQLSRMVVYWHTPITIDIRVEYCPPCVLAYPSLPLEGPAQPLAVAPYVLPFALERTHYRWVSVPEGYEVPGVRGTPYTILTDLGGFAPNFSLLYRPLIRR